MNNHLESCVKHLKENFGFNISHLKSHLINAYDKKQIVYFPEYPFAHFINSNKEKEDLLFLNDLSIRKIRTLTISERKNDFRFNHEIRGYKKFNNDNMDYFENIFKDLSYLTKINKKAQSKTYTTQIFLNDFQDDKFINLDIQDLNQDDYLNTGFKIINRITVSEPLRNFSRSHIIQFENNGDGFISLRFCSRNKKPILYFDKDIKFNDYSIKNLITPSVLIREDFGDKLHSILEIRIPFKYSNSSIVFDNPLMRTFSGIGALELKRTHPFYEISYESPYKTKDFRDIFNILNKKTKKEIKKPTNLEDLVGIIDYWKLVHY